MSDQETDKTPAEQALDHAMEVFVYAPIGLLFEGASLLPQLVEKGRNQVTMAKMIGQFAVTQGSGEANKLVNQLQDQAITILARLGGATAPEAPVVPTPPAATPAAPVATTPAPARVAAEPAPNGPSVDVSTLAIPDYDGLSASHVVNRLAGLSDAELESVRTYEAANRGRKTILSKIAQLQAT